MRSYLWLLPILMMLLLPACYHMRVDAVPISTRIVTISGQPQDAASRIRTLVEEHWKGRILETDRTGTILITSPYLFYTDTSFGQPAGGRKYYTQLRIEVIQQNGVTTAHISHYNFELRTSYAYSENGRIDTLYKHYPYEHYPGMFNLDLINREMDRAAADIRRAFQENR